MIDDELNGASPLSEARALGLVVGGSLSQGVEIRLDPDGKSTVEDLKAGSFVTIHGNKNRFFGVVTDLTLENSDPRVKHNPPPLDDKFIAEMVSGTVAYGTAEVKPFLPYFRRPIRLPMPMLKQYLAEKMNNISG